MENADVAPKPTRQYTEAQKYRSREREKAKRDALLASGCCIYCARPRVPNEEGGTPKACAPYAEMHRARTREYNALHPGVSSAGRDRENLRVWRTDHAINNAAPAKTQPIESGLVKKAMKRATKWAAPVVRSKLPTHLMLFLDCCSTLPACLFGAIQCRFLSLSL